MIQVEPYYFNYIIYNNSNIEQLFHIVIYTDDNKYSNNNKNDIIINFVSNSEEYEYITILNKLVMIPSNYNSASENENFILGAQKSIPLLFNCLSYNYNCLKVKGFPFIHFEFHYKKPKESKKK